MSLYPWGIPGFGITPPASPSPLVEAADNAVSLQQPIEVEPGASAYLGGAAEMHEVSMAAGDSLIGTEMVIHGSLTSIVDPVIEVAVVEAATPVVEAVVVDATPIYPIGKVDFNKPIIVSDVYDDDRTHTDVKILVVLSTHSYPVVIQSTDPDGDDQISQFDTDGDEMSNGLSVRNIVPKATAEPEVFVPRTVYVVIESNNGELSVDSELYDSESEALKDVSGELLAIFPITIDVNSFEVRQAPDDHDDIIETESEAEEEGDDEVPVLPEGAVYVNGVVRKLGDKVTTNRAKRGHRSCTIIKTRPDPFKSLYVQSDNGDEEPYWARNQSVLTY